MLPDTPLLPLERNRSLVTAFRSPATTPTFAGLRSWLNVPGLLLRFFAARFRCPFGLRLRYPIRFAPVAAASTLQTRCSFHRRLSPPRPPAPLPLGTFTSLRIEAFNRICYRAGPPSESARFPFAPRSRSITRFGCGSSFQVRYVSGGLLFLKPLGTSLTMRLCRPAVKSFSEFFYRFHQHLCGLFLSYYGLTEVDLRWKKTAASSLFLSPRPVPANRPPKNRDQPGEILRDAVPVADGARADTGASPGFRIWPAESPTIRQSWVVLPNAPKAIRMMSGAGLRGKPSVPCT